MSTLTTLTTSNDITLAVKENMICINRLGVLSITDEMKAMTGNGLLATVQTTGVATALKRSVKQLSMGKRVDPALIVAAVAKLESANTNIVELDRRARILEREVRQHTDMSSAAEELLKNTTVWDDGGGAS